MAPQYQDRLIGDCAAVSPRRSPLSHNGLVTHLRVLVPADYIMDGMAPIPTVGDHVGYWLRFRSQHPSDNPEMITTVVARVQPLHDGRLSAEWTDPLGITRPRTYSMLLTGAGWSAYFTGLELFDGEQRLTGIFEADWSAVVPVDETTATATRVQLETRTSYPDAAGGHDEWSDRLKPVPKGKTGFCFGLKPVEPLPAGQSGWVSMAPPRARPWEREIGVLVDLDTHSDSRVEPL